MKEVVLASNNLGKLNELNSILEPLGLRTMPQSSFGVIEAEETGLTFVENAILKARNAAQYTDHPVIADDSGLEVDFLKGEPGIYSARYAGPMAKDPENNQKLMQLMEGVPSKLRGARFRCVLVFMRHSKDPSPIIAQGIWEGQIAERPSGRDGFGYDPLFLIPSLGRTVAELPHNQKNDISHRAQALRVLADQLSGLGLL